MNTTPPTKEFNGIPPLDPGCWLAKAFVYTRERSQLPDSAVFWTLMAFCGAALQDRVYVNWAVKPIFPNVPLLLVGPSGIGKTGAMNVVAPLFERFLPFKIAEDSTAESVARDLAMNQNTRSPYGNTCAYWTVPELADVFGRKDYQQGIVARVTRLLDNPFNRTVSRSGNPFPYIVPGFCIFNWMAGTTMDWLRDHVDSAVGAGGFLPRLFVCMIEEPPKFVPNPQPDPEQVKQLQIELMDILPLGYAGQEVVDLEKIGWDDTFRHIHDDTSALFGTPEGSYAARRAENLLRIYLILSKFGKIPENARKVTESAGFQDSPNSMITQALTPPKNGSYGNPVTLPVSEMCAKWFETQALKLDKTVKVTGFGRTNALFHRVVLSCKKHPEGISYTNLCKNLELPSRALSAILLDLKDQGILQWNGQKGKEGVIKLCE